MSAVIQSSSRRSRARMSATIDASRVSSAKPPRIVAEVDPVSIVLGAVGFERETSRAGGGGGSRVARERGEDEPRVLESIVRRPFQRHGVERLRRLVALDFDLRVPLAPASEHVGPAPAVDEFPFGMPQQPRLPDSPDAEKLLDSNGVVLDFEDVVRVAGRNLQRHLRCASREAGLVERHLDTATADAEVAVELLDLVEIVARASRVERAGDLHGLAPVRGDRRDDPPFHRRPFGESQRSGELGEVGTAFRGEIGGASLFERDLASRAELERIALRRERRDRKASFVRAHLALDHERRKVDLPRRETELAVLEQHVNRFERLAGPELRFESRQGDLRRRVAVDVLHRDVLEKDPSDVDLRHLAVVGRGPRRNVGSSTGGCRHLFDRDRDVADADRSEVDAPLDDRTDDASHVDPSDADELRRRGPGDVCDPEVADDVPRRDRRGDRDAPDCDIALEPLFECRRDLVCEKFADRPVLEPVPSGAEDDQHDHHGRPRRPEDPVETAAATTPRWRLFGRLARIAPFLGCLVLWSHSISAASQPMHGTSPHRAATR